ncbi:MAG: type II toxin-antitoxin system VapC family toxin [Methylobacter sp.]
MYLLDTNVCIGFLRGRDVRLLERFEAVAAHEKYLCSIVIGELVYGAAKSKWQRQTLDRLNRFIAHFPLLDFDLAAARHFGDIRAELAQHGAPIGPYDLQIAAIARAHQ